MEKKCEYCGSELKSQEEQEAVYAERRKAGSHWSYLRGSFCDGILTLGTDPFAEEIHGDFSESWDCEGNRHHSAMEI